MASLSNPLFEVDILTGMPHHYVVEGSVNVELSPFETWLVSNGLPLILQSNLFGEDSGSNREDNLFAFSQQNITAPGTYTFSAVIPRGVLNEDNTVFDSRDEVYQMFRIVSGTNLFTPAGAITIN